MDWHLFGTRTSATILIAWPSRLFLGVLKVMLVLSHGTPRGEGHAQTRLADRYHVISIDQSYLGIDLVMEPPGLHQTLWIPLNL